MREKMMTKTMTGALLLVMIAAPLAAQAPATSAKQVEKIAPLKPMLGSWKGHGWIMMREGKRESFTSSEIVSERLSGAALMIEGKHVAADDSGRIVHDALGIIAWSPKEGAYRFRTTLANGMTGEYPVTLTDQGFKWGMPVGPNGRIEYVITISGQSWKETGSFSADGVNWRPMFEMVLERQ